MPKITDGLTSDDRKQAIRKVLEIYGKLNREDLFRHVSAYLEVDVQKIRSSLYKDLNTLAGKGEIEVQYFYQDGTPMTQIEIEKILSEDGGKNFFCTWSLVGYEDEVKGAKLLSDLGGHFFVPNKTMQGAFLLQEADQTAPLSSFGLLFSVGNKILRLSLDHREYPATLIIARSPSDIGFKFPRKEIIEKYGHRASLLTLPHPTLSSCQPDTRMGHLLLQIVGLNKVKIFDLGSRNGTEIMKIGNEDLASLELSLAAKNGATAYASFASQVQPKHAVVTKVGLSSIDSDLPFIIFASKDCRLLIR